MNAQRKITGKTKLVAIIGKPAFHSKSPETHNLAWQKMGVDAVFLAFEVGLDDLDAVMEGYKHADGWYGITVTMPLKQAIIKHMDHLSDTARLADAVNVVIKEEDGTIGGYNSDGPGFMNNLKLHGFKPDGAVMTLIGPGGAGRAAMVQAALEEVARINVFAREGGPSFNKACEVAAQLRTETGCDVRVLPFENKAQLKESIEESDVLVNSTNIGMGIGNTDSPVEPDMIKPGMFVADIVNTPRETQLLKDAADRGCTTVDGIGMLDQQAVVADRIRFGIEIPIEKVRAELETNQ